MLFDIFIIRKVNVSEADLGLLKFLMAVSSHFCCFLGASLILCNIRSKCPNF